MRTSASIIALVALSFAGQALSATFSSTPAHEILSAPQLTTTDESLSLTSTPLLGRYGLTADRVLQELAPHLAACTTQLVQADSNGLAVHEVYSLQFGSLPIAGAYLHLHHYKNSLVMVRASLPDFRLPRQPWTASDFLPLAALGFEDESSDVTDNVITTRQVIADFGGLPSPSWEVTTTEANGRVVTQLIEAMTGAVLDERETAFDLAEVYAKGPQDGVVSAVELPGLPGTGYLDGAKIQVFAPTANDPRVMAPDGIFDFRPDDPADNLNFDQVQSYYAATRALAWFETKFGFVLAAPLPVRVHADLGAQSGGAYVPPPTGPEVRIGADTASLVNLARDSDVVSHELSHHIIYQHVQSSRGESGILHEGTADYFAYAINGDPNLGESVVPGKPYLRTAALAADLRYDTLPEDTPSHKAGQYWSAVLWDLRQTLGESADQLVYVSLSYLGPNSGLRDGLLALVNADRDLSPLPDTDANVGVFGTHQCLIIETALRRGFAAALDGIDGSACSLDLAALAEASRLSRQPEAKGKSQSFTLFGRTCAVVGGPTTVADEASRSPSVGVWLLLFMAPLLCALAMQRRRKGNSAYGS